MAEKKRKYVNPMLDFLGVPYDDVSYIKDMHRKRHEETMDKKYFSHPIGRRSIKRNRIRPSGINHEKLIKEFKFAPKDHLMEYERCRIYRNKKYYNAFTGRMEYPQLAKYEIEICYRPIGSKSNDWVWYYTAEAPTIAEAEAYIKKRIANERAGKFRYASL